MARQVSPATEREYARLNAFLDLYATHVMKIDPADPAHPTNTGQRIVAAVGKSKALVGLRQAVNDCLEGMHDLGNAQNAQLDAMLRQSGVVTLTELLRTHSRRYQAILKRGRVRNETEYYMVKAVLDDGIAGLAEAEKVRLGSMLLAFEQSVGDASAPGAPRGLR